MSKRLFMIAVVTVSFHRAALAASRTGGPHLSVTATGGRSITTWHGQATIRSIAIEWGRDLSLRTELFVVAAPYLIEQPRSWFGSLHGDGNEIAKAASMSIFVRRRFERGSPTYEPYVEIGSGPMWANRRVPAATSRFNFITQPGFGMRLFPKKQVSLVVGYRFLHISNGGYAPRNPGLNVNSLLIGTTFRLR